MDVETGYSLENDEGWKNVKRLIELARSAPTTLSAERKQRIRDGLMERLERDRLETLERERNRRLMARSFAAGVSTTVLAGLLLKLVSGGLPWLGPPSTELARKQQPAQHSVAE